VFVGSITVMSPGLLMVELAHLSRVKASLRRMPRFGGIRS